MRASEFIHEEYLKIKETDDAKDSVSSILSLLQLLRSQFEDKNIEPTMSTEGFLQLVKNTGAESFSYQNLVNLNNTPEFKELVKSFDKHTITLTTENGSEFDDETTETNSDTAAADDVVASMAKNAANI